MGRGIGQTETEAAIELWQQVKRRKTHRHSPPPVLSDGWGGHREALVQVYGRVPDYQGRGRPPTIKQPHPGWHYTQMVKQRDDTGKLTGIKVRVIYGDETTLVQSQGRYVDKRAQMMFAGKHGNFIRTKTDQTRTTRTRTGIEVTYGLNRQAMSNPVDERR